MDIQIDKSYEKEATLIRYASLLFNNSNDRKFNASKIVTIANNLKLYAYPTTLVNNYSDSKITDPVKPCLTHNNAEKLVLEMNQVDSHFVDSIGVSDIDKNIQQIFDAYNHFYDCGNFDKFIRAGYRFLKRINGANEYDMNDIIMRYMVCCICMNDYSNCINIIETVGQNYVLFDYNIYLFFLYFTQGKYNEACEQILNIKNNVCDDFYKYVNEKDLAFYFSFCLLFNFNIHNYKQVLSNNDSLVYKLYDKYREFFGLVDDYYRCDYLKVNSGFNQKLKAKIDKDPFLSGFSHDIEYNFKKKILKEILTFSSEISFEAIKNLLLLKSKERASELVIDLIRKDKIPAIIDDIEGIVIVKEKNPINEILEASNQKLRDNLKDLIKYSISKNVKHKLTSKNFNGDNIERMQTRTEEMGGNMPYDMHYPG